MNRRPKKNTDVGRKGAGKNGGVGVQHKSKADLDIILKLTDNSSTTTYTDASIEAAKDYAGRLVKRDLRKKGKSPVAS